MARGPDVLGVGPAGDGMPVRVVTADGARARDGAAIAAGVPAFDLMRAAGEAVAATILARHPAVRTAGALVVAGAGNNGGDAWVVAGALARHGCPVRVETPLGPPRSPESQRAETEASIRSTDVSAPGVVVDGLLGVGVVGPVREAAATAIQAINALGAAGAVVVAIDLPSGLDATTGAGAPVVRADLTCCLGTLKRGVLLRRDEVGEVVVLDIGLGAHAEGTDDAPALLDADAVRAIVPPIPAEAHKGVRRRLAIVGGAEGMAGAPMFAARGAMRSGIGMTRLLVAQANVPVVQGALPEAMAGRWPLTEEEQAPVLAWADVLLLGPGLGLGTKTRALVERLLVAWRGPVVLDADALNVFEGEPRMLGALLGARPAVVTPHPAEAARLLRADVAPVLAARETAAADLARTLGATVLLKGPPTVIAAPDGRLAVSASGSPALGIAGSGDVLAGIVATLLAQTLDPFVAAGAAAWVHGRAGERAAAARTVRGTTLDDVLAALAEVWRLDEARPVAPVLAALPAVGRTR